MSGDAAALWPRVAEGLRRDLGVRTFDHWLKPVRFADYCTLSGVVTLETASRFSANWINERFGDRLELAWRHHLPSVRSVLVRAGNATAERGAVMAATPPLPTFEPRSEEHTSELQSLMRISYAVFCLKKKTK